MKDELKTTNSPTSTAASDVVGKADPKKPPQDEPRVADDAVHKIDRPGFDLSGSSDAPHAGTGLGLGKDSFGTPGDRRLPGRRLDGKLTIPRWSAPEPKGTIVSAKTATAPETEIASKAKTAR